MLHYCFNGTTFIAV